MIPSTNAVYLIRKMQYYANKNTKVGRLFAEYFSVLCARRYGIYVSPRAKIGLGLRLPHPVGIIIGECVNIGERCTIYQNVTIGSSKVGDYKLGKQPSIGDDCIIFSGAKVIGDIEVAEKTLIGANAVVNKSVKDSGKVLVGVPAKIINN